MLTQMGAVEFETVLSGKKEHNFGTAMEQEVAR